MHKHSWFPFAKNVIGEYAEKRNRDPLYFAGMVEKYGCGKMQMIPDDPRLYTVEVDLA